MQRRVENKMKDTQIHWHSTDEEIEAMTSEQAIELLEKQIAMGKNSNPHAMGPRKHMVKAFELAVEALRKECDML